MKKLYFFAVVLFTICGYSQFNSNAPWMKTEEFSKIQNPTMDEIVNNFDKYWENKDKNAKGSGYKPFMRWENHWRNKTDKQGYLITPQEMWKAFNEKNAKKANRAASLPTSVWEPIGPFTHTNTGSWSSGQGRVNVVYVDPSNANTVYIGTPAGGIWKSTTGGTNWVSLSDNLPQIGVSGIAVDPNNSNIIYISTGDCDGSDTYSVGVMKSIDGGLTWNTTGLVFNNTSTYSGDIIINPSDSNMLLIATSVGIRKSTDAGATWTSIISGDFSSGRLRIKPNNPNTVYTVSNNNYYKSTNFGTSFTPITTGLPATSGRLILDVTAANENVVYVLSVNTSRAYEGLYKSIDSGETFTRTASNANVLENTQAFYDLALAVSQTNENEVYTGCLNIWRSTDGGTTFIKRNSWNAPTSARYTHADIHYLRYFGTKLYCGSDGGIYVSDNNSTSFSNLTASAQISQFYKIAVSKQSASKMVGGLQDNGGHAYSNNLWKNYYGADGMDTAIDPSNSNLYYGFIQFGGSLYISNNAGNSSAGGVGAPSTETGTNDQGGNWITPLVTNSLGELYAGYSNLYKLVSGAWVQQNTNPITGGDLELIEIDPSNNNIMYVTDGANLYKSIDKGATFNLGYTASGSIRAVEVHSTLSNIIYITTQGTGGLALKSIDGGQTFTSISTGLPNIGKNCIVHQARNANNPLFIGTSLGVYYRDDSMAQWEPFDTNLPNVSVTDLDINLEDQKITAATYGRGIWQANIVVETPLNDIKMTEITTPVSTTINCTSNTVAPQVIVKNNGSSAINAITFNYAYNSSNYTYNWTGVLNPNQSSSITLPQTILNKGLYNLNITTVIANDEVAENNTATKSFVLNSPGTLNAVNAFENTSDELLTYDDSGLFSTWQRGICTSGVINTGSNNVYTTNFTGNYADVRKAYLVSGCYNLTQVTNPQLSFKMAFDLENNWDIVYVEYTIDNGATWLVLGQMAPNWYNSDRTPQTTGADCNNCKGAQWTGTAAGLNEYSYSLNAFTAVSNVTFRIVFHSDDSANQLGVVVDDFLIGGTLADEKFELKNVAIFPNPSSGIFNISTGNKAIDLVEVYDVTGKVIVSQKNFTQANSQANLDLRDVANGIYFVKITSDNQSTVKRIIKN